MTEETIFEVALSKRDPAERSAYLDGACGRDAGLRQRIETLLKNHEKMGDFLRRPALEQMAEGPPAREAVTAAEQAGNGAEIDLDFLQPAAKPGSLGRLAHYEVLEVLGRGGCGIVLKAFDEKLHRMVAIKVMAPQLASTSPARKRFLREARSAAAVRHDNVVGIYAIEDQPIPYLVMEYIAGQTLQQKLDQTGPLDVPEVLSIGRQIAGGLAVAHALGVIHRDIKPSNILLENGVEPRVKITDFGLARAADDASLSQSGLIAGTPLYMSPEQARGETIDQRTDLFSLGSVLYVMCCGRPPFRAANTLAVLNRVAQDSPRPIREIIPEVPKWLCAIVAKLHAKKPEERFASAAEVADLLGRHLAQLRRHDSVRAVPQVSRTVPTPAPVLPEPIESARPKIEERRAPRPARPSLPRKWLWAATAAAVSFLLLAGLGLSEAIGVTNVRGTVIRLFSPRGTLVVEVDDPDVSVKIDDDDIVITGAGVKEIRVKPGEHKIQASKDGKLVRQELVTVSKNGRQVVRVSKEAGPMADAAKPEKPKPAERRPLDVQYVPADASAALVVQPRRIVQSPLVAALLPPGAADEMLKELGVQAEQIEQAIVFVQMGVAGGDAPPPPVPPAPPPPKDDWTALDSKEGRFSIRFPVKPKSSERKTTLGTRQVFAAETDEGNTTFELSYVDFPKNSPIVGDLSRVDFATRALEFKPGFKDKKDIKFDKYPGADVVLDDVQLKKFFVHRVYVVGDRLYHLEAMTRKGRKPPAEFARFFDSFKVTGDSAPPPAPPAAPPPDLNPLPGAILRFAEPVDGKRILTRLLKGLREEVREGKTYYRSSTGEGIFGLPLAGSVPDERTVLVAPEPVLRKMLAAGRDVRSPLLDRLRQKDDADEITGIVILETHRDLLRAVVGQFKAQLPPSLGDATNLPDHLVAATASVNLADKTLLKVSLESDSEDNVAALDNLAFKGLALARKVYPDFRPTLIGRLPAEAAQSVLAIVDQLYGGIQVAKEGKRLIVRLEKPESLGAPPSTVLIASAGFNDAEGMNSNPVPGTPYPLGSEGKQGGSGEVGWAGPWSTSSSPRFSFQKKVVYEGDGALYLSNGGGDRRLAEAQTEKFQVEMFVQAPDGGGVLCYLNKDGKPFRDGPVWAVKDGRFRVLDGPDNWRDTGFACQPRKWHKVTLRVDVATKRWQFFVDGQRFATQQPLCFRNAEPSLNTIRFQCETQAGIYIDALRFSRDDLVAPPSKDLLASAGFNDARGMNSNPVPGSPYPLDAPNRQGGIGEPGWTGPWLAHPDAVFQSKVVFEGDGALYLKGRPNFGPNYGRQLTKAQSGKFQVEYHLQVPAGSSCGGYLWQDRQGGAFHSGPNWGAGGGKFTVHSQDTGLKCLPGRWYKVTLRIDVAKQTWEFFVDDRRFESPKPLGFRTKVEYLDFINFLVEGGVYIDDLRVTRLPED